MLKPMKGQQIVTLGFTFFIGFCCGVYLYLTGFTALLDGASTEEAAEDRTALYEDLAIEANMYGSCPYMYGCPSFQVRGDRQYSIVNGEYNEPQTGELPASLFRALERALTEENLTIAAAPAPQSTETCPSAAAGVDVSYTVAFKGEEYWLDSCQTALFRSPEFEGSIDKIWEYLLDL